jgi:type I restriction enzyme M protein
MLPKAKSLNLNTPQALNSYVWSICDVLRRSNCAGALQYVPELSWMLFLRILDEREGIEAEEEEMLGGTYEPSLQSPYRWRDWAAPYDDKLPDEAYTVDGEKLQGWKRRELQNGPRNAFLDFVNKVLFPHLKSLRDQPNATARQKVISEILASTDRTRVDTEKNLLDVLDMVDAISEEGIDATHQFPLSQVYEGLLLKMGEKGNDGGQFFTPREVIRAVVKVVNPEPGETVYDPCCGTGGFLAQAYEHMASGELSGEERSRLKNHTFYGREKENVVFPIALANLALHGIDQPHLWHGNTLTNQHVYDGLFLSNPERYNVVLTNPPFGGKEAKAAQSDFDYKTSATQVLFLQHVLKSLAPRGRCGIVLDEGVLFRTNEQAFVQTKTKLLNEFDLYCVLSLPGGAFSGAGAGVKTNVLFFNAGKPTEKIWYYDLSDVKVGKKSPLTLEKFREFLELLPERADSERSWTVDFKARRAKAEGEAKPLHAQAAGLEAEAILAREAAKGEGVPERVKELFTRSGTAEREARELRGKAKAIEDAVYDLKAVNPNAKAEADARTPAELLDVIEAKGLEVAAALEGLRRLSA